MPSYGYAGAPQLSAGPQGGGYQATDLGAAGSSGMSYGAQDAGQLSQGGRWQQAPAWPQAVTNNKRMQLPQQDQGGSGWYPNMTQNGWW
jgi:hypothetical protein